MKTSQPDQGINEDVLSQRGAFLEDGGDPGLFRVVEFGGLQVPEDGLVVHPPSGGELTVWSDGSYAITASMADWEGVATHYSYVVETPDGATFTGSFSLGEASGLAEAMQDFHAWSLPGLMDGAVEALLSGETPEMLEFFAPGESDHAGHAESMILADVGPELDDLTRLILESHNS
jgi:hypothetical protein